MTMELMIYRLAARRHRIIVLQRLAAAADAATALSTNCAIPRVGSTIACSFYIPPTSNHPDHFPKPFDSSPTRYFNFASSLSFIRNLINKHFFTKQFKDIFIDVYFLGEFNK